MTLSTGTRLGPYEITSPLGAGGMGEVYRARDSRLDRTVAIKVLPAHVASDPDRRARFEREAKTISALSHPHICGLFDIGEQDGITYLVMEHLEGETLAQRLEKGPLPFDQVLRLGIEIADALARAHKQGIVHRDLKPANVMLTKSGAKLLDFGLAKALAPPRDGKASVLATATRGEQLTAEGTILGTFQYMSPEQLEGKEADARSDIWALGCVLYEMVAGQKAFTGKSHASLISAILKDEPAPVSSVRPMTPAALDRIVRKCLAKDPDERWESAHDLVGELRWIAEGQSGAAMAATLVRRPRRMFAVAVAVLGAALGAGAAVALLTARHGPELPPLYASLVAPDGASFDFVSGPMALSPDGRHIAFVAREAEGEGLVWVRSLDSPIARRLPGTEGASYPFWSPDGRRLAFFARSSLHVIAATGGAPEKIADVSFGRGGDWNGEDVLLFCESFLGGPISRLSLSDRKVVRVTALDAARGEVVHSSPHFLPDGRHFLYVAHRVDPASQRLESDVYVQALGESARALVLGAGSDAVYVRSGHVLFWWNGDLMAQRFDAGRLRTSGEPFAVARQVQRISDTRAAIFSATADGTLALAHGGAIGDGQLVVADRSGRRLEELAPPGNIWTPRLSRDGRRAAAERIDPISLNRDIWLFEVSRAASPVRFTFERDEEFTPVWSRDGRRIAYSFARGRSWGIRIKEVGGSGAEDELLSLDRNTFVTDWWGDPGVIAHNVPGDNTPYQVKLLSVRDRRDSVLLEGAAVHRDAEFSPDGRWFAYVSWETGRSEVYVRAFSRPGGPWQISTAGGRQPHWRDDGRELFYLGAGGNLIAVPVKAGEAFEAGAPQVLFRAGLRRTNIPQYDVFPGGQRFLLNVLVHDETSPITLVQNWPATVRR